MTINTIDAPVLRKMFLAGAKSIEAKKEYINELNVFPVPDGDTGTNMTLTIMSAAKEVGNLTNPNMKTLAKAISSGSLRGARGNSGVILSQLFRGFTKEISAYEEIDVEIISAAFDRAVETAYKAVMKPKEGTILTVAKGGAKRAAELALETDDIVYFGEEVLKYMKEVLDKTPDMLPVLKEAGVVDSGGQGLLEVLTGAYNALTGKEIDITSDAGASEAVSRYGYKAQIKILIEKDMTEVDGTKLKAYLESIGDFVKLDIDKNFINISVNTDQPGQVVTKSFKYGTIMKADIETVKEEAVNKANALEKAADEPQEPRKPVGFISVSIGEGINEIFKGIGVDYIIEGGQTMNPSTEDILDAISKVNADDIYILPNNGNIILAANQAASLVEDKNIHVVPTKTVPQGITAVISFSPDKNAEENMEHMAEAISTVKTGSVTYAVRDTNMDGKEIKENDIMGIGDKTILAVGTDINDVTQELIAALVDEDSELICLYYGEDVSEEAANELADKLAEVYTDMDIEVNKGGQPIYYYVLSVE